MAVVAVYLVGLVGLVVVACIAWSLLRGRVAVRQAAAWQAGDRLVDRFGAVGAAAAIALAGLTAIVVVLWPVGEGLARQEHRLDRPVFDWMNDRLVPHSLWWRLNEQVSNMGNNDRTKVICVVASVVLAVAWRRRAWWIPPLAIFGTYAGERIAQQLLKVAVDRGHPPTTLGTYPSGGCGRLISVWGIVLLLVLLQYPMISRQWRRLAWRALALAAYSEGYSRTYLLKHWFTDVIGGWLFGVALLAVFSAATVVLVRGRDRHAGQHAAGAGTATHDLTGQTRLDSR